ncbi:hypothetical protein JR316_0009151 [Psilocybe cubensis]|nr:hypothetical protein JR316_0009151 [Psilocybe cubensis]KAH9478693.1 hypothetical protein JR316_0009151 [Psilocybe cubensis]
MMMYHLPLRIRIVKLNSPWQSLFWTFRLLRWKHKFPSSYKEMQWTGNPSTELYMQTVHTWQFLAPFFASKGYRLHTKSKKFEDLIPEPLPPHPKRSVHPFGRFIPSNDINFAWYTPLLWAARDSKGRDVVIK